MPKLSVFPKGFMDDLCVTKTMTLFDWIDLAATLDVDGVEMYPGFFENFEPEYLGRLRQHLATKNLEAPMMCASPDFTQPDEAAREREIEREKQMIDVTADLGGNYCRVLSGQRREEVSRADGVRWTVESIKSLLPYAAERGVVLIMENHYKDGYWLYPEFAQPLDIFTEIIEQIDSPSFGVNYDPSNAIIGGEDPLDVLEAVKHRVVSMHASDRYLISGTLEDIKKHAGTVGYAKNLKHGVIGQGLNDYDAIFSTLRAQNFDGWISIEDGENGMGDLQASVDFLRRKMAEHFPSEK
ncbi:MAG TPA: sugar phosphate isomerase/epimerase family protein [Pyrinomonadaceae bacterium]|jgi:sugar phosphate isomerase/epimerase|nr:sugar phosphate isomerase/epimerase family protein [Pyrinomonadaceae bacterium]